MGFSVSTVAVRGKDSAAVHAAFGLASTGEWAEEPDAPVAGALLPGGWYLIFVNDRVVPTDDPLATLSADAEVVTCDAEEHVMCGSASGWADGRMLWRVTHDAGRGASHLEVEGTPPAAYAGVAGELSAKQRAAGDADYLFDVPVELARALTGFRYDGNPDGYPVSRFERLRRREGPGPPHPGSQPDVPRRPPPKPWWAFWR